MTKRVRPWPTPDLPPAPISAKTHGDPRAWTKEQWVEFRKWAASLKDYPGERPGKMSTVVDKPKT